MRKLNFHHSVVVLAVMLMAVPASYFIVGKLFPSWAPPQLEVRKTYQKPERPVDSASLMGQLTLLTRTIQSQVRRFDKEYRINFPFRSYLLGTYQFQKETLLRADPYPQKVFEGKQNWLFIGNSFNNTVYESIGVTQLPVHQLLRIKHKLEGYYAWCKRNNIRFYFMPVPEKQTVFARFYPIRPTGQLSVLQQVVVALGPNPGFLINVSDTLCRDARKALYAPTDTHWTGLGAYIAYSTMLNTIKLDFPAARLLKPAEITLDTAFNTQGDLSKMLFRPKTDTLVFLNPAITNTTKLHQKIRPPKTRNQNFIEVYEQRHSSNANGLKAMIYRDSFFVQLATCTNESFGETILLWDFRLDTSAIKNEKPDIVILECAERMVDEL
jgi:hypothetical protein